MIKNKLFLGFVFTLCSALMFGQLSTPMEYDFTDGIIIPAGQSPDGVITLEGNYSFHSANYGLNMKVNGVIKIKVEGSTTISFLGSKHSSLDMQGASETGTDLGTQSTTVVNDLVDTFDFEYKGTATTLIFTLVGSGTDLYLPSLKVIPETTIYDFTDKSIFDAGQSADGKLSLIGSINYHSSNYGLDLKAGGEIDIAVDGSAIVRFIGSKHSSLSLEGTAVTQGDLGTINTKVVNDLSDTYEFTYVGGPTTLKFVAVEPGTDVYLPALEVLPYDVVINKTDVWDFGAEQLDETLYNNQLSADIINGWYDSSITPGTVGPVLPSSFTAGDLSWTGGSNDRLRSTNTDLTRYDENISDSNGHTGRIYVNSAGAIDRYLELQLNADDIVTLATKTDSGGLLTFENMDTGSGQKDEVEMTKDFVELKFTAKETGSYKIYDSSGKPSYYRVYRQAAEYISLSGQVDISAAANIPDDYTIQFTNEAGKTWSTSVTNDLYSIDLPADNTYMLSLGNANGYIITNGDTVEVSENNNIHDIVILQVDLFDLTGAISGIDDIISNLELTFTPDPNANKIYTPIVSIDTDARTYSVKLEADVEYTITASGVNDFEIENNTVTIGTAAATKDLNFVAKPVYNISINAPDLNSEQLAKLSLTFTNTTEENAVYTFTDITAISLRNGVYSISYSGLDEYPIELALTSNLTVENAEASKELSFVPVTNWSFDDKVISSGDMYYKGLMFSGSVKNEIAKGHLDLGADGTIAIPVNSNTKIIITYYYAANFTIENGDPIITTSGSTSTIETTEYIYTGADNGTVTLKAAGTTYITNIFIEPFVDFASEITVGTDKEYQTVNAALKAIASMVRPNNERVTVLIDPGNYEEMLVINTPNVTLKNASATPSIAVSNKGVDIDANAVRITSYYGHGYSYYSMGSDQKWHEDVLKTNKENGSISYQNAGAGTTNGSYWNATVVISANGFEADSIIFENSFNQYISKKESEDILVLIPSENKGTRPTTQGNTDVQDRSYVERAAAIAVTNNTDKVLLIGCKVIGRQDTFYGGTNTRVVAYKGEILGAVDYIFGGMTAVFYKTDLVMNTSDVSSDAAYLTAAQQDGGRGYLMYECTVTTTDPGVETASQYRAKPGYFGRPWRPTTSEVVFYNTSIETSNYPGSEGLSLIVPDGWRDSLGGQSEFMYEYGSMEDSGVDNSTNRVTWSTLLTEPVLKDGTEITTLNFTKGNDGWDPIKELNQALSIEDVTANTNTVNISAFKGKLHITNVKTETSVQIYNLLGQQTYSLKTKTDRIIAIDNGIWFVKAKDADGTKTIKLVAH
ncbi:pectinesterase family protein [Formosa sp. S-31]|uniref:pectinesterase family protein n=1 Tax=Formosa sp. S-31 TaxID=2790949 RepID=UPI003EBB046F